MINKLLNDINDFQGMILEQRSWDFKIVNKSNWCDVTNVQILISSQSALFSCCDIREKLFIFEKKQDYR